MLGLLAKQRKMKTLAASELSLPDVSNRDRETELETQIDRKRQKDRAKETDDKERKERVVIAGGWRERTGGWEQKQTDRDRRQRKESVAVVGGWREKRQREGGGA